MPIRRRGSTAGKIRRRRIIVRYEATGHLDARAVEALMLEIRLLARRYKVTLTEIGAKSEAVGAG